MVRVEEIKTILQSLPKDVLLTQCGNESGVGSLLETPSIRKGDWDENVKCFNVSRIESALLEIPNVFQKARSMSRASSYGLKHALEKETGVYVTNGEFIIAMLLHGFDCRFRNCVNPVFNVKQRQRCQKSERVKEDKGARSPPTSCSTTATISAAE